jgi:hypothetical protein
MISLHHSLLRHPFSFLPCVGICFLLIVVSLFLIYSLLGLISVRNWLSLLTQCLFASFSLSGWFFISFYLKALLFVSFAFSGLLFGFSYLSPVLFPSFYSYASSFASFCLCAPLFGSFCRYELLAGSLSLSALFICLQDSKSIQKVKWIHDMK